MDIKKLYADLCAAVGEIPLYVFLLHCDMFARMLISEYGVEYVVGEGEYSSPESLEDSFAVCDEFYHAAFLYIKAALSGEESVKSEFAADKAYLTIWRKKAANKRIKKEVW